MSDSQNRPENPPERTGLSRKERVGAMMALGFVGLKAEKALRTRTCPITGKKIPVINRRIPE